MKKTIISDKQPLKPTFSSYLRAITFILLAPTSTFITLLIVTTEIIVSLIYPKIRKYNLSIRSLSFLSILVPRIIGIKIKIKGLENIPHKGCVILFKHMSMYETCVIAVMLKNITTISKIALKYIPIWNVLASYIGIIWVERGQGKKALLKMLRDVQKATEAGRNVAMFPEGTRTIFGQDVKFKLGIMQLYPKTTFVPAALNFGMAFGRKFYSPKFRGTAIIQIMKPIPSNLSNEDAKKMATSLIAKESDKLCAEFIKEQKR